MLISQLAVQKKKEVFGCRDKQRALMPRGGACQVWTEGVIVQRSCYVFASLWRGPRGHCGPPVCRLCGSFVLVVYTPPYLSCYSSSPDGSVSARGGLLHPRPTPVVIRRRVKAHAQMCNRFLCSLSRRDAIEPDGTVVSAARGKSHPTRCDIITIQIFVFQYSYFLTSKACTSCSVSSFVHPFFCHQCIHLSGCVLVCGVFADSPSNTSC